MMNLLIELAGTGAVGPIHGGMTLAEATAVLGPGHPHPAIRLLGGKADGYPHRWDSLYLTFTRDRVSSIKLEPWPGHTFSVPSPLAPEGGPYESTVTKQEFLAAVDEARIGYADDEHLTSGDQTAIRFADTAATALFAEIDDKILPGRPGCYLLAVSKHFEVA
ncbi:hypothetical protein [Amycolatopsis japonica]|uniref:hypothetical protein n=1 Tax=Amycolatopsis japonica TaxID=208439 RepID=UPI0037B7CECE